jgi:NADPH-dependent 2,4-dienoyl-CoA reductase/sulfur reductase-like enzyme
MRWMNDCIGLDRYIAATAPKQAVIVGGGYIGVEMADALIRRGLEVTIVEFKGSLLTTVDPSFGILVEEELERHGVSVLTGVTIESIERSSEPLGRLIVTGSKGLRIPADMVLVAAGVEPESTLARASGISSGITGAIKVSRKMATNSTDIYAAGDCVETWHRLLGRYTYLPLGTTAHKQGRIAGENVVGNRREYMGTLGTQAVKVFDTVVARTGLNDEEAANAGFEPVTVAIETWDHKVYYPGAYRMHIRLTGDRSSKRILGAQLLSHRTVEVSKRIDIIATALYNEMEIDDLNDIDLSYTPPLSSPWDPVQLAAQEWRRASRQQNS